MYLDMLLDKPRFGVTPAFHGFLRQNVTVWSKRGREKQRKRDVLDCADPRTCLVGGITTSSQLIIYIARRVYIWMVDLQLVLVALILSQVAEGRQRLTIPPLGGRKPFVGCSKPPRISIYKLAARSAYTRFQNKT
jgi:hypothetical protein